MAINLNIDQVTVSKQIKIAAISKSVYRKLAYQTKFNITYASDSAYRQPLSIRQ